MAQKKIYMLTSVHPPLDKRIYLREALSLVHEGYAVTIIAPHDRRESVDGVDIIPIPKSKYRLLRMFRTWKIFKIAKKQPADLFHFHDPELLPIALLLKWVTRKPVIYDVHEYNAYSILSKYWIPRLLRKPVSSLFDKLEKRTAKHLSGVIAVNEHMQDLFLKYNKNTIAVNNYPVIKHYEQPQGMPSDGTTIIYLGYISPTRGLETILDTVPLVKAKHPDARFLLVGPFVLGGMSRKRIDQLERFIQDGMVETTGEVPFDVAMQHLEHSAIGWIPLLPTLNYQHAKVIKLFEYALYSKPIVASRIGFIAELVKEMECGLVVDPYDAQDHAGAINYLLEHPEEQSKMGASGRKTVLAKYNWESEAEKMLDLYKTCLNQD